LGVLTIRRFRQFRQRPAPFTAIIYDNGHEARELNEQEQHLLAHVCGLIGYDIDRVGIAASCPR
jgi:hypothetical protein